MTIVTSLFLTEFNDKNNKELLTLVNEKLLIRPKK